MTAAAVRRFGEDALVVGVRGGIGGAVGAAMTREPGAEVPGDEDPHPPTTSANNSPVPTQNGIRRLTTTGPIPPMTPPARRSFQRALGRFDSLPGKPTVWAVVAGGADEAVVAGGADESAILGTRLRRGRKERVHAPPSPDTTGTSGAWEP